LKRLPGDPLVNYEEAIDKFVEELTSDIQEATAPSSSKCRPRADPRPAPPASIEDEIRLKNQLRSQWQIIRDPGLKAQLSRLQRSVTYRQNEWRNEQWNDALEFLDSKDQ
jgi:hypothetical protein